MGLLSLEAFRLSLHPAIVQAPSSNRLGPGPATSLGRGRTAHLDGYPSLLRGKQKHQASLSSQCPLPLAVTSAEGEKAVQGPSSTRAKQYKGHLWPSYPLLWGIGGESPGVPPHRVTRVQKHPACRPIRSHHKQENGR